MRERAEGKLVSIIVPVYKVEQYLAQCIDSLLCQSYSRLEIWLIDDGSPDQCGEICEQYARKDNRIHVIHQDNRGLSAARNAGLENATGDYLMFVDSDDFVEQHYVEHMKKLLEAHAEAQIGICRFYNYRFCQEDNQYHAIPCASHPEAENVTPEEIYSQRYGRMKVYYGLMTNKIFRSQLFEKIRFPEGRTCEDVWTMLYLYSGSRRIICSEELLYYYRNRKDSISGTASVPWVRAQLDWLENEIIYFVRENRSDIAAMAAKEYLSNLYRNWKALIQCHDLENKKELVKLAYEELLKGAELTGAERIKYYYYYIVLIQRGSYKCILRKR